MFNSNNSTPFSMPVAPIGYGGGNGNGGWGDDWIALAIIAMIFGWGGMGNFGGMGEMGMFLPFMFGGFPNGFSNGNSNAIQADIQRGFDTQSILGKLDGINSGICSLGYDQLAQMNGINQNVSQQGFNISSAIAQLGYQNQNCCCETNRNIDSVRYENAKNTCDIINAGNANTQRIIDHLTANEMQTLRDQLQTANFQLSQQAQSANLINQLRPCPIPAYLSCSPYTSYDPFRNGYGYGGCGCGNSSGCGCC